MTLLELADACERTEGGSRELDAAIYAALNSHMTDTPGKLGFFYDPTKTVASAAQKYHISGGATGVAPRYTDSLDAAMQLFNDYKQRDPDQFGFAPSVNRLHDGTGTADVHISPIGQLICTKAATPALALTATALRARHAMMESE